MTTASRGAVVVTGASTGIGAAAAERLARDGFLVFAGVRTDADAANVEALHENVRSLRLDVTDAASIAEAATAVTATDVPLHGLVNNAGIAVAGPLEFLPLDLLRRQFEVNFFGTLAVTQAFLPLLRRARGRIVFVGSISGRLSVPFIAPYSTSKFALRAAADALRIELRPAGIAVVLIEPSSVKTPIWQKGRDAKAELMDALPPEAHAAYGEQIASVYATTEGEERAGMPVGIVSDAIAHALTARKPRANYLLGKRARAGAILAVLHPSLRERAVRRSMRLP